MNKRHGTLRVAYLSALLLIAPVVCFAEDARLDDETIRILEATKDYTNPYIGAATLLHEERHEVRDDRTVVITYHVMNKVLTEAGKTFSPLTLPYDARGEQVQVLSARTIQPDGTVLMVPAKHIVDEVVSSGASTETERVVTVTFPKVGIGSILDYRVAYTTTFDGLPTYSNVLMVPPQRTVLLGRFIVDVPQGTPMRYKAVRMMQPEPTVTSFEGATRYVWEVEHVWVEGSSEELRPAEMFYGSYVHVSTIPDWQVVATAYAQRLQTFAETTPAIHAKVQELLAGTPRDPESVLHRLHAYVSQEIQPMAESGGPPTQATPAAEVLARGAGDSRDKCALLIAMLRSAGLPATYALARTTLSGAIEPDVPSILFDYCLVAIPDSQGYRLIDPVADLLPPEELPFFLYSSHALILDPQGATLMQIPIPAPEAAGLSQDLELTLTSEGTATLETTLQFQGPLAWPARLEAKYSSPKHYREGLKRSLGTAIPNIQVESLETSDYRALHEPYTVTVRGTVPRYAQATGDLLLCKVPGAVDALLQQAVARERREAPLELFFPRTYDVHVTLHFPTAYRVRQVPEDISFESPAALAHVQFTVEEQAVTIHTQVILKERHIPPGQYPRFRQMIHRLQSLYAESIVLERNM